MAVAHDVNVADALAALREKGASVVTVGKAVEAKSGADTSYCRLNWNIKDVPPKAAVFFVAKDIPVMRSVNDPKDASDKRNKYLATQQKKKLKLQTTVKTSGDLGTFLQLFADRFEEIVRAAEGDGMLKVLRRQIHTIVQSKVADSAKEGAGNPIEDPIIRLDISFDPVNEKFPVHELRGKPTTHIYDFDKCKQLGNNYVYATVKEGDADVPLNVDNLYKFLTAGCIVKKLRFRMDSIAISQSWVSLPITITHMWVQRPKGGFKDNDIFDDCEDTEETYTGGDAEQQIELDFGEAVDAETTDQAVDAIADTLGDMDVA